MGHHFSKPTARANSQNQSRSSSADIKEFDSISLAEEQLQAEEIVTGARGSSSPAEVRQIIIKIQLAKMENGNTGASLVEQQFPEERLVIEEGSADLETEGAASLSADTLNANGQIVNVGVGLGVGVGVGVVSNRTAGSSTEAPKTERQSVNNNNLAGSVGAAISTLQLHDGNSNNPKPTPDDIEADADDDDDDDDDDDVVDESLLRRRRSSGNHESEVVEYCEVLESLPVSGMLSTGTQLTSKQASRTSSNNSCCRSRSSKAVSMGASVSSSVAGSVASSSGSKRRCCKCKCRDAFRGLRDMLPTSSGSNSSHSSKKDASAATTSASRKARNVDRRSTPATLGSVSGSSSIPSQRLQSQRKRNSVAVPDASHHHHQVIIRITSPRFVVESPNGRVTVVTEPVDPQTPITPPQPRPMTVAVPGNNAAASSSATRNVTVHSQIDFMHCLVPDLEKITNSSFYWGKMDRYEAEHLLEGKPEGTFLLRDSAQDEFLFSVTFRKYGRSLHARIEQSGHKFSFDCHDPCVFTAPTVTGLLEHYKDPACVMFFEPCLTMPLHRRQTFSLQQLARATIVSNTNYDGVNQLELPGRLKSYLKEYHYKQKLRVKPCDLNTPQQVGFAYYEDVESQSEDEDEDDEAVNIRVSYVQHAEVVAQLQQQQQQQQQASSSAKSSSNLQEQLSRLPNRMAAALGRMSANLNCYQSVT
ncbi:hypothetical protein KR074_011065 [Drosophila pseudoananassae]|nr:hypothetical protein KR074_011065 [Drosophila pseudoananassae]